MSVLVSEPIKCAVCATVKLVYYVNQLTLTVVKKKQIAPDENFKEIFTKTFKKHFNCVFPFDFSRECGLRLIM